MRGNWASHVTISRPSTLTCHDANKTTSSAPPQTASAPPHAHRDTVKNGTSKRFTKRSQLVDKDATVVSTTSNKFASTNQRSRFWVGGGVYLLVSRSPPTAVIENSPAENKASRLVETGRLLVFSAPPYSAFPGWGSAPPQRWCSSVLIKPVSTFTRLIYTYCITDVWLSSFSLFFKFILETVEDWWNKAYSIIYNQSYLHL